jgi:hypothetical protein
LLEVVADADAQLLHSKRARLHRAEVAKVLADAGANLEEKLGCTALKWVAIHGVTEVSEVLPDADVNVDLQVIAYKQSW